LDVIEKEPHLGRWPGFHIARADLLQRLDRHDDAAGAYRTALELEPVEPERAFIRARLQALAEREGRADG
jgi:RNA polymerase sigma-70 factor (ECF subfamily)